MRTGPRWMARGRCWGTREACADQAVHQLMQSGRRLLPEAEADAVAGRVTIDEVGPSGGPLWRTDPTVSILTSQLKR